MPQLPMALASTLHLPIISLPFPPPTASSSSTRTTKTPTLLDLRSRTLTRAEAHLLLPRLIKSCAAASRLSPGVQLHALSLKLNLSADLFVQTSLISMYSSCSRLDLALHLFDQMPHRNVVAWTAAIDACLRFNQPQQALSLFVQMLDSGIGIDTFALVGFVSACAAGRTLLLGCGAHGYVIKLGMEITDFLGSALVDMYSKCGCVDDAVKVFDWMTSSCKTVQVWNAMLHGMALHGLGADAVQLFDEMREQRVPPNAVTFVALLCGCAHAGLVIEGKRYFDMMREYGIEPTVKHYGCMVDLLGRAGLLDKAFEIVNKMPVVANQVTWGSLLNACRMHNNIEMAEIVFRKIVAEERPMDSTSHYLIMSNMYKDEGVSQKVAELRTKVGRKPKGRSWIEMGGQVHQFGVGIDVFSHPLWEDIKAMLDEIEKDENVRGEQSEATHSEKVAVAFGLITTKAPTPIRIFKNLRICHSCHDMMKMVSQSYRREIVVRDCSRFHRFIGGVCSCKDYW